jgi:hypothetical protein
VTASDPFRTFTGEREEGIEALSAGGHQQCSASGRRADLGGFLGDMGEDAGAESLEAHSNPLIRS